jgi:hypothetical protein
MFRIFTANQISQTNHKMLDQLIQLVKEHAGEAIVNNPAIPNEQNDAAISQTAGGIMEALKGQMSGGNLEAITGMFKGGNSDNPLVGQISTTVQKQLSEKFNLDAGQAGNIVQQMIPVVMSSLVKKTNDPNDNSFNMDGILSSIGGGKAGDLLNSVKGMFGN